MKSISDFVSVISKDFPEINKKANVNNKNMPKKSVRIDPWGEEVVKDYDKLFRDFGIKPFKPLVSKIPNPHFLMRRGIIFGHRDFERILDCIKNREEFAMLTGLMPSGRFHLGHAMLANQIIHYQKLGAKIFLCVADIEAYNMRRSGLGELRKVAIEEYLLNYIALGLKPKNLDFYFQSERGKNASSYCKLIGMAAKKTTFNEMKAIYGELSPGKIISVMFQVADILHPELPEFGGPKPVIVPVGIDQDPHIRLTRDIASRFEKKFKFILPSSTYHKTMLGLKGEKMSSSDPYSYVALTDDPGKIREKIMKYAFSGGRGSVKEHRKLGGIPEVDVAYNMLYFMFETDDKKIKKIYNDYKSGRLLTGELKNVLIEKLELFLRDHQKKREKAKKEVDKFLNK